MVLRDIRVHMRSLLVLLILLICVSVISSTLSVASCCHFFKKMAYLEEFLETCILYSSTGCYYLAVSTRNGAPC
jgi:ABC-type polysaccharide/polyol phosphate export permease